MKNRKLLKNIAFAAAILLLLLVIVYSGLRILEPTLLKARQETTPPASKTIERNGIAYFPRQDITTVMVLGIDQYGPAEDSGSYQNTGAADMAMLLIFNEANDACTVLQLNRDTMVEIPVLGLGGRQAGTDYAQLALAHTYGSGLEDSCENARQTISDLLYGIRIDYYVSMRMDAIAILNDAVGGVTVNVTDDFSKVDPSIGMGTVTLNGEQAINYVRTRKDVGDQLNLSRIQRQKDYVDSFAEAFRAVRDADPEFFTDTYEAVEPYLVTDCSANTISGMIDRYGDYAIDRIITPQGENVLGEQYYEFYLDEAALDALILELFYAPKQ